MGVQIRKLVGLAAAAMVALSGCSKEAPLAGHSPRVALAEISSYVALGDSYSSGPYIDPQQKNAGPCLRSTRNYASILAKDLKVDDFKDVTCAGASTIHILHGVPSSFRNVVPAQVKAVNDRTDLVTVGIGFNDEKVFGSLFGACLTSSKVDKRACRTYVDHTLPSVMSTVGDSVTGALTSVRRNAPHASVVLVGYLPVLTEPDACKSNLFTPGNERTAFQAEQSLDTMLGNAAKRAGTEFLSMRVPAVGHGACAGSAAWVNGNAPAKGDGAIFHPRAVGMVAVAKAIEALLRTHK